MEQADEDPFSILQIQQPVQDWIHDLASIEFGRFETGTLSTREHVRRRGDAGRAFADPALSACS